MPLDPCRLLLEAACAELAGPHAPDLLGRDEPGLLQDADVLLHAGEGHVEPLGEVGDRSIGASELLENAASGGVRNRGERGVEVGLRILNHVVQYVAPERRDASFSFASSIDARRTRNRGATLARAAPRSRPSLHG